MAIVFNDISTCPICGNILSNNYIMFPPLISNTIDSLFIFSDNGVHIDCLNNHPLRDKALAFRNSYNEFLSRYKNVEDPKNTVAIGLLTSDDREPLYKFNFILINYRDLKNWIDKDDFLKVATNFIEDNKWIDITPSSNYLKNLINKINSYKEQ